MLACPDVEESGEDEGQVYDKILRIHMQTRRCIWGCSHSTRRNRQLKRIEYICSHLTEHLHPLVFVTLAAWGTIFSPRCISSPSDAYDACNMQDSYAHCERGCQMMLGWDMQYSYQFSQR